MRPSLTTATEHRHIPEPAKPDGPSEGYRFLRENIGERHTYVIARKNAEFGYQRSVMHPAFERRKSLPFLGHRWRSRADSHRQDESF